MHEWEEINQTTHRMRVDNGWIYRYMASLVFVPDTPWSPNVPYNYDSGKPQYVAH